MKYEKIDMPTFDLQDIIRIKMYTDSVAEVTRMHYDAKPDPEEMKGKHYKKTKYKTPYSMSKELKRLREMILTNITPEDIPYTYFLTYTNKDFDSLTDVKESWNNFSEAFKEKYGDFKFFTVFEISENNTYHIHSLIYDPEHTQRYEFIKFDSFRKVWGCGDCRVKRPKDFDDLINIAFYITKSKNGKKILRDDSIFAHSEDIKDVPQSQPFDSSLIANMEELFTSSYRLYDDKNNTLDVSISRTLYIVKKSI